MGNSALRNFPFVLGVLFGAIPLLWVLFILVVVPFLAFELFVTVTVESGVRLGDILGNTLVTEHEEDGVGAFQSSK